MPIDRIAPINAKIERAEEHIRNLHSEAAAFFERNHYRIIVQDHDPETGDRLFQIRFREEPTTRFSLVVGDVAHNLRSALDHLAWQLVRANGKSPNVEKTSFPIFKHSFTKSQDYESAIRGKVHGASDEAVRIIKSLNPYKGGTDAFWNLRQLNNIDKHRLLITVGFAMHNQVLSSWQGSPDLPRHAALWTFGNKPSVILNDGAIIWRTPAFARAKMDMNPQFRFEIAFGEGEVFERDPVIPTLMQLTSFVKGVVEPFIPLLV